MSGRGLEELREGGKAALARALADLERVPDACEVTALLDEAYVEGQGVALGVTGPPGVGKSSLIDRIVYALRQEGKSVAVIAVDPSSTISGGALLGDRARLASLDPLDEGVFFRSMASRGKLGGVTDLVYPSSILMRALYDVVIIETVGVGQSEIDVSRLADATMLCVQPASGDTLQFLKAGIMEVPDLITVTKSDLGAVAERAASELQSVLSGASFASTEHRVAMVLSSTQSESGMSALLDSLGGLLDSISGSADRARSKRMQGLEWMILSLRSRFGEVGLEAVKKAGKLHLSEGEAHFARLSQIAKSLEKQIAILDLD